MEWIKCSERLPKPGQMVAAIRISYPSDYWIGVWMEDDEKKDEPSEYWIPIPDLPQDYIWVTSDD